LHLFEQQVFKNRNIFGHRPARRREGYIGEGAFSQRLPYADFFGYFLVQYKKVTLPYPNDLQKLYLFLQSGKPADALSAGFLLIGR